MNKSAVAILDSERKVAVENGCGRGVSDVVIPCEAVLLGEDHWAVAGSGYFTYKGGVSSGCIGGCSGMSYIVDVIF